MQWVIEASKRPCAIAPWTREQAACLVHPTKSIEIMIIMTALITLMLLLTFDLAAVLESIDQLRFPYKEA